MRRSQIAIFISFILVIQFLGHFVVYEGVIAAFSPISSGVLLTLRIFLGVLTAAFVLSLMLTTRFNNFLTRFVYRLFAVWQGFLLYFFLASLVLIAIELFATSISPIITRILYTAAAITGIYGVVNARNIRIKKVDVKLTNLPEAWRNKKAVLISDLHLGQINTIKFAEKIVKLVNAQNPDVIFIAGDLYDGVKVDTKKIIEPLKNLQTKDGVYFITGNHDGFTPESTVSDVSAIEEINIKVLQNKVIDVAGVQIVGADYRATTTAEKLKEMFSGLNINKSIPSILLKHVPDHVDVVADAGVSLMLSGHTHRAQLWPFSYLPKRIFKGFDYDLKRLNNLQVYTSSGVGTWGPPLRVGTQSEVVVITFI